ncbi:hypothetical protein OnM2_106015 [Erysiphe neolycopersici]|uniref:Uncharacterized protein n=1 Tax=Erysiphe neolycopersici TaxID=212602 RepID=A0A420H7E2_9PEZI|nr:hypothetical protein OnM2_106015 [Erysiphe neolycopersici]
MNSPDVASVRNAYRHLYKGLLRAVQYSKPARYCARDELRCAFRKGQRSDFDARKIARTIEFLELATKYKSVEHQIIRNLLQTKYWAKYQAKYKPISKIKNKSLQKLSLHAMVHYERSIEMLNSSLNICLR